MSSTLGTPLPRPAPSWFWFVVAGLATLWSAWGALFGQTDPLVPAAFAVFAALVALAPKLRNPPRETVQVDDHGVLRVEGGVRQQVRWEDLSEVRVITTDGGPFVEDAFFALSGSAGENCVVSQAAAVRTGLIAELTARLPDLDQESLLAAMAATRKRHFVIWSRGAAGPLQ